MVDGPDSIFIDFQRYDSERKILRNGMDGCQYMKYKIIQACVYSARNGFIKMALDEKEVKESKPGGVFVEGK